MQELNLICKMALDLVILDERWNRFLFEIRRRNLVDPNKFVSTIKGNILPIWNYNRDKNNDKYPLVLNHTAFKVKDLDGASKAWQSILDQKPILATRKQIDPVSKKEENMNHFYSPFQYYVTLIEAKEKLNNDHVLDHIGYEASDFNSLIDAKQLVVDLNYKIIWEGEIDSSYVIHFEGPDKVVHDFFLPSKKLRGKF